MNTFASLVTERLVISPLRPADAETFFGYRSDPEVSRFQCWQPASVQEVREFIANQQKIRPNSPGSWFQLAIRLRETDQMVGDVGLHFSAERDYETELGVSVAPEHQGCGYASEALRSALSYLFEDLGKRRITGSVDPRNLASIRLLESLGMRKEAHFRESMQVRGEWVDDLIYALLRREWKGRRA